MAKHETSTTYRWPASDAGLVDTVEIVRQKNGRAVAYLHAKEDPTLKQKRLEVRAALRLKGWGTLSDFRSGQYVLRVNGLRDDDVLLSLLHDAGYTHGKPTIHHRQAEKEKPQGLIDSLRTNSLRVSGILYSLGNAIYIASGIHRNSLSKKFDIGQIGTGLAFGSGDILVATIGGKDDGRQLTSLLTKLRKHYDHQGIDIPVTAAIHSETSTAHQSLGSRIYTFLHNNVNVIKCLAEVVGGYFYFKAGKEQKNKWKQATAVIFSIGFGSSALIKEKKMDEEKYAQAGPLERLWMRIQSNPLSVGGISGYSNTIFTTAGAIAERKTQLALGSAGNKLYRWDFAAPTVMAGANGLYALSKKTTGGDIRTEAMVDDVYSVASQILNKLPEGKRAAAVESTVRFLAERPEVRGNKDEVREKLVATMTKQRQNPWFEPIAAILPAPIAEAIMHTPSHSPSKLVSGETTHIGKVTEAANQEQVLATANGR